MRNNEVFSVIEDNNEEKQKHLLLSGVMVLFLLILIVLINLRITDIKVLGNRTYTDEEVIEMIMPSKWDRNPVYAFVKNRFTEHKSFNFVSSYNVNITGFNSCEIIIYEKNPVGYIEYMSGFMYFDKDGIIIESDSSKRNDIPEITGLKFGHIVLGRELVVDNSNLYEEILNITQQLQVYQIECQRISFDSMRNVTLFVDEGDIKVKLGSDDYLSSKLSLLNDVIEKMRMNGMKGTADLSSYTDRGGGSFSFIPD